jgi:hypothetical protein
MPPGFNARVRRRAATPSMSPPALAPPADASYDRLLDRTMTRQDRWNEGNG